MIMMMTMMMMIPHMVVNVMKIEFWADVDPKIVTTYVVQFASSESSLQ